MSDKEIQDTITHGTWLENLKMLVLLFLEER